jgi:saccharopine dehydrogenase (NAD+, L-lysine-forming)
MASAMVIGMGGVGSVIGQKLHEYDCFERILLADVDPTFAEHLREKTKSSRFQVCTVNAMDTAKLITLMRDHGIAVTLNACPWQANHSVLEACHRAGSHYLDMAADIYSPPGLKRPTKNSLEAEIEKFNQPFLDKGIAGILHGDGSRSGERLRALGDGPARHRDEHSRPRR